MNVPERRFTFYAWKYDNFIVFGDFNTEIYNFLKILIIRPVLTLYLLILTLIVYKITVFKKLVYLKLTFGVLEENFVKPKSQIIK